jgi:hypothetical protein
MHVAALFQVRVAECGTFTLVRCVIRGKIWDPTTLNATIAEAQRKVAEWTTFSELDQLRFEYAIRSLPCPLASRFSQGKRSKYFTNANLNKGTYSWALLPDEMLDILDRIYIEMSALGYQVQLNSCYRNPVHNEGEGGDPGSQHQFGRAVDFQTFDFDESGAVDATDWTLLRDIIKKQSPTGIESMADSGIGHVHAQWTNIPLWDDQDLSPSVRSEKKLVSRETAKAIPIEWNLSSVGEIVGAFLWREAIVMGLTATRLW